MILYNEIFPEGDITKGIYVGLNEVKFVNIGDKLVYDTFSHVTYDDPIIDIIYPVMRRGGCSGIQLTSPTITYQLTVHTWGHSGNYYGSVIEEGSISDFTVEGVILNSSGAWIDKDGIVYRESLNTTYKPSTWNIMEVTISAKINGKSSSSSVIVLMESNTRTKHGGITTYGSITAGNITNTVIPAKGTQGTYYTATAEEGKLSYNTSRLYYLYLTEAEETIFDASSGSINIDPVDEYGNICSSISINNCDSKGTNISAKNIVLAQTVYWNSINSSDYKSGTMIIYQDINKVTNITIGHSSNYHCSYPIFDAAGDTNTPSGNAYFILTYSSTDTHEDNGIMCYYRRTYKDNNNSDVFTLNNSNSGSISVPPNYSTSEKSGTISSTLYAEYTNPTIVGSDTVSDTLTHNIPLTQEGDYLIGSDYEYRINIKADKYYNSNLACPASGDSVKLTVTPQYRRITYWRSGDITYGSWTTGNLNEVSITSTNSSFILNGTTITIPENTETLRQSTYTATYHKKTASVTIYLSGDTIDYYDTPTITIGTGMNAKGGSTTVIGIANTHWTSGKVTQDGILEIVSNGNNRFTLGSLTVTDSNTTAILYHENMKKDGEDTVIIRVKNSRNSSYYTDSSVSCYNEVNLAPWMYYGGEIYSPYSISSTGVSSTPILSSKPARYIGGTLTWDSGEIVGDDILTSEESFTSVTLPYIDISITYSWTISLEGAEVVSNLGETANIKIPRNEDKVSKVFTICRIVNISVKPKGFGKTKTGTYYAYCDVTLNA